MSDVKERTQGAGLGLQLAAELKRENTWIAKMPLNRDTPCTGSVNWRLALRPAAMPATWLPWAQSWAAPLRQLATVSILAAPALVWVFVPFGQRVSELAPAVEKQASRTILPTKN